MSKKKNKITLEVIGGNSESVTGSCTKITTSEHTYLFELGMIQDGHTILENYRLNSRLLQKIKPQNIEYIMIGHLHIDHIGLIPALYKNDRCDAIIVVPEKSTAILREMWLDSSFINGRDVDFLNLKSEHNYEQLYSEEDVENALSHVKEVPSNTIYKINDTLSIRYSNAGHILLSKQAEVFVNENSSIKKILFTSDLGNIATQESRIFVEDFEQVNTANIVIGECTYSARGNSVTKKTLETDLDKIKSAVEQYCIDNKHRILIPTFSLDRMPYIIWILYSIFGSDDSFNVPIIVDSPLSNRLLDCYSEILDGEQKEKFDEMMAWKNIKRVIEANDSKACVADSSSKIILSSSGMITAGRSIKWAQSILPNSNDLILFIGYCSTNSLAHKIKNGKEQKTININGKPCKNNCQIIDLHSFSSHMQRDDLIKYYKSINCEKICLVHSSFDSKLDFKRDLEKELSDCCKSTRVVAINKGTKITL